MGLSSTMWTSVTGLLAHGEKMNVVGNNIANVSTVAFKADRMDFATFVSQSMASMSGNVQVGRGVSVGTILSNFSQGSIESTTSATDLAVYGEGFFCVSPLNTSQSYLTRAGNFSFNADGYLVDPNGYALQGWAVSRQANSNTIAKTGTSNMKGSGALTDVKLDGFTCEPQHTNNITAILNLAAAGGDNTTDATDPFFALWGSWKGSVDPALGDNAYVYPYTTTVYDESGTAHTITVYFDQVTVDDGSGNTYWEYIVTMDPSEDVRDIADPDSRGLLMAGTLTFDSTGQFVNQSAYVPTDMSTIDQLATWEAAPISSDGYPMFACNFSGRPNADTAWDAGGYAGGTLNTEARPYLIELNLGLRSASGDWDLPGGSVGKATEVGLGYDPGLKVHSLAGFGDVRRQSSCSVSYDSATAVMYQSQDGYTFGYVSEVYVDTDGVLWGKYSNGQNLALYQLALFNVTNPNGLYQEGGNLYSVTNESGDTISGAPNSAGLGKVYGYSLEQSNVDLSTEFVYLITTQRGFQANSKTITTVDTMLETVIGMKR